VAWSARAAQELPSWSYPDANVEGCVVAEEAHVEVASAGPVPIVGEDVASARDGVDDAAERQEAGERAAEHGPGTERDQALDEQEVDARVEHRLHAGGVATETVQELADDAGAEDDGDYAGAGAADAPKEDGELRAAGAGADAELKPAAREKAQADLE
jgi:hypothetical protein